MTMRPILACVLFALSFAATAKEPSAMAKQEIDHLMKHLATSGCQFNRNGTWYDASQAVSHLKDKYDYLVKHDQVTTAEDFVTKAASESSASGKPYFVKCEGQAQTESSVWFRAELARFRSSSAPMKQP